MNNNIESDIDLAIALSLQDQENIHLESHLLNNNNSQTSINQSSAGGNSIANTRIQKDIQPVRLDRSINQTFHSIIGTASSLFNQINTSLGGSSQLQCVICKGFISSGRTICIDLNYYHINCFRCAGCNNIINEESASKVNDEWYHSSCKQELFDLKCTVCCSVIHGRYTKHCLFNEFYCIVHKHRTCFSCQRMEPLKSMNQDHFQELSDGRSVCYKCISTAIFNTDEMKLIYFEIIDFMKENLKLPIPSKMYEVPILAVDSNSMKENLPKDSPHIEGVVRGLTLSTKREVRFLSLFSFTETIILQESDVTAVLILFGMPRDLTASIIAHECIHVWIRLQKVNFPQNLSPKLEEGLCQLISSEYLKYLDSKTQSLRDNDYYNKKLRDYFLYIIEKDESSVYGDGYRDMRRAIDVFPLDIIIESLKLNHKLPNP